MMTEEFFAYAREREKIRLRKEAGEARPWTKDRVLQSHYFCNVFREDDRTTAWFRERVRNLLMGHPRVLLSTVAFRWFNRIETGKRLLGVLVDGWEREQAELVLRDMQSRKEQIFTGAYLIKSPPGKDKVTGILDCIDKVREATGLDRAIHGDALQGAHLTLMQFPYLGPFMAYEIVTDLTHTYMLKDAPDLNSWASAGPGCARGLAWVHRHSQFPLSYGSAGGQEAMLLQMRELLRLSRFKKNWPWQNRPWSMREVEHTLCEFDKYCRGQAGQKLKRKYDGG